VEGTRRKISRGACLETMLCQGKPLVRFICRACGATEYVNWQRLLPGVTLACSRCGLRITVSAEMFDRIRAALTAQLRHVQWQTPWLMYPRVWIP